jgi:ribosomal protein L29
MKKKDLRSYYLKKANELEKELSGLKLDFAKTKLNINAGREKNLKKAKNIGKKISQIMTILKYKKVEEKAEEKVK